MMTPVRPSLPAGVQALTLMMLFSLMLLVAPRDALCQPSHSTPDWSRWQFLLGEWRAEGGGDPGTGAGEFSFALDLQRAILTRKSHTDYPAAAGRPAFTHDDLMIIYQERGNEARAIYFDNEGHVIQYAAQFSPDSASLVFLSSPAAPAPRFRLTYTWMPDQRLRILFEIAPPGKPEAFSRYLEGYARKKEKE